MALCVFWYPTIYHSLINERLRRFVAETSISDFGSSAILRVVLTYPYDKKENVNLEIERAREVQDLITNSIDVRVYKMCENGREEDIFSGFSLKYKHHSRNGMVVYEYEKPTDYPSQNAPEFTRFLTTVCYHYAKTLFHDHEVQSDRDSGLFAYIPNDTSFDYRCIQSDNNEVLLYYLHQYDELLDKYAEEVSTLIRDYDDIISKFEVRVGQQDTNGGVYGYNDLVDFGLLEFIRWCNNPSHKADLDRCIKDVLNWNIIIHPRKSCIRRRRKAYFNKMAKILQAFKEMEKNTGKVDMLLYKKYQIIVDRFTRLIKDELYRMTINKQELYPISKLLAEIEIELGIYKKHVSRLFVFRKLRKAQLEKSLLTENNRKKVSQLCEGASTEYVYCKTLLESRYNKCVRLNCVNDNSILYDDGRRMACNIKNSMRYIGTAQYRYFNAQLSSTHSLLKKAGYLSNIAVYLTVFGTIMTIIGVILAFQ